MRFKLISLCILISSILLSSACKQKEITPEKDNEPYTYQFSYKYETKYQNEYNNKNLITKRLIQNTTTYPDGTMTDYSDDAYQYDSRDSLYSITSFHTYKDSGERVISSIDLYSDSTQTSVIFREYPKDTLSYSLRKKNKEGLFVEEYSKNNMTDLEDEKQTFMNYAGGVLIASTSKNLISGKEIKQEYKHKTTNDTLYTQMYRGGELIFESKKYNTDTFSVEVTNDYEDSSIDSTFIINNKVVKQNYYGKDEKRINSFEYDEYGNESSSVFEVWVKE